MVHGTGVTRPTTDEAAAAASYHALLHSDPDLSRETGLSLDEAHREQQLLIRDRPLCNVLRPRFITRERSTELARISALLAALFERAGGLLLPNSALLDRVGASDQERSIWEIDPGYSGFTLTSRLDSFMVAEEPRFVEYNAESPAGIGFCDCLSDAFLRLPVMRAWSPGRRIERFHGRRELLATLLWAYDAWGGVGTPNVAIIDWSDVITKRDFELCAEFFREAGIPSHITDPRSFEYRSGKLWLGDVRIDLVYRRVLLHELLERSEEAAALLQAYRDGAVCLVNSPRSKLLHKKAVLALLSDPSQGLPMEPEERRIVQSTIPWTRRVETGATTYMNGEVDFEDFVLREQQHLVLKPSDDYGGRGVVLGWEVDPPEWEDALGKAVDNAYIVQERVPVPRSDFPVWGEGDLRYESLLIDTNPLLFRGKMGSILTRMSGSALLNVTAGTGSTAPTFILHPEEN